MQEQQIIYHYHVSGSGGCTDLYITEGPLIQADIYCTSKFTEACKSSTFALDNTETINLECDTSGSIILGSS